MLVTYLRLEWYRLESQVSELPLSMCHELGIDISLAASSKREGRDS